MRRTRTFMVVATTMLALAPAAGAATFTVVGTGDTAPATGCDGTECPSIRAALVSAGLASDRDTIVVPAGNYQLTQDQLTVNTPVDITGAGARTTIVRG